MGRAAFGAAQFPGGGARCHGSQFPPPFSLFGEVQRGLAKPMARRCLGVSLVCDEDQEFPRVGHGDEADRRSALS